MKANDFCEPIDLAWLISLLEAHRGEDGFAPLFWGLTSPGPAGHMASQEHRRKIAAKVLAMSAIELRTYYQQALAGLLGQMRALGAQEREARLLVERLETLLNASVSDERLAKMRKNAEMWLQP